MNKLEPRIRFEGFDNELEKYSIKDLAKNIGGGTPSTKISKYWKGDIPWIQTSDIDEGKLFNVKPNKFINNNSIENSAAKKIEKVPAIAVVTRVGVGKIALINNIYSSSQDFLNLFDLKPDPHFFTILLYKKLQKQKQILQGTSIKGITKGELLNIKVLLPKKSEQEKIGRFFEKLDDLIENQESYLDLNKKLKKSLLQKLFPKEGEDRPELRFSGFNDVWKKIQFNDIYSKVLSGNRLPKQNLKKGSIPYILAQTDNNGIYKYIDKYTKDFHGNRMKKFYKNSITFSIDNPEAIFLQKELFYTSNIMRVLYREDLNYNHQLFFMYSLKKVTKGYDWSLKFSGPVAMKSTLMTPFNGDEIDYKEIEKIGSLFKSLDEKIEAEEKKLKAYKDFKKSMLQKMFV